MRVEDGTDLVRLTVEAPPIRPPLWDELAAELRAVGFEPSHATGLEERSRFAVWEFALRVWDYIDEPTAGALVTTVVSWIRSRSRRDGAACSVKLYGPDGRVRKEVQVDSE